MHLPKLLMTCTAWWLPLICVAAIPRPAAAQEETTAATRGPIKFLGDGRIQSLQVGGTEASKEDAQRNGVALLWFNGIQVKSFPLTHVTLTDGQWVLVGERPLPRCTFTVTADGPRTVLRLSRVEGFPRGRDTSIALHLGLAAPLRATCSGQGILLGKDRKSLDVTWTFPGQGDPIATWGTVTLEAAP